MSGKTAWDDTIAAIATAPGIGAIATVRLSGPAAFAIANALFPAKDLQAQPSHTLQVGYLVEEGRIIDEVVISLFKSPRSYTGEDVIEISGHGSPFVQQQILEACIRHGARLAKPGEFTQRAFLNGKLDLTQAEAVADLIASNTGASQRAALHAMRGGFSEKLKALRERLIRFSALIELELDFSQEDVEFADRRQLYQLVDEVRNETRLLLSSFQLGNVIKNGVSVAIVGKPNAGKSTLLNSLLNENRAIVSDIPGTTRDTIEEILNIDGILFRLIDTAGIRQHTTDLVESEGVERSLEKMKQSDLVIYLFDVRDDPAEMKKRRAEMEAGSMQYLLVGNKIDTLPGAAAKYDPADNILFISAQQQLHTDQLKERMTATVLKGRVQAEDTIITNTRHYQALLEVAKSISDIRSGLDNHLPGDLLALDIRRCLHYLGEITGEVTNDDMLDYIFSKFCIGK